MDPELSCPHAFIDDEDFQLEIECAQCAGANDLGNSVCLSRTISAACYGGPVDAIVLKRTIHKRYRGDVVQVVALMAAELAAINRSIASCEIPSDRECRTCPASTRQILVSAKKMLLREPYAYHDHRELVLSGLTEARPDGQCNRSRDCIARAVGMLKR